MEIIERENFDRLLVAPNIRQYSSCHKTVLHGRQGVK